MLTFHTMPKGLRRGTKATSQSGKATKHDMLSNDINKSSTCSTPPASQSSSQNTSKRQKESKKHSRLIRKKEELTLFKVLCSNQKVDSLYKINKASLFYLEDDYAHDLQLQLYRKIKNPH